jgi:hypothetical protein
VPDKERGRSPADRSPLAVRASRRVEVAEEAIGMGDEEKREEEAKYPRNAHVGGGGHCILQHALQ